MVPKFSFANYFRIENYTYIGADYQPKQSESSLNISQIGGEATFSYWKLNFNTKLLFQSALSEKNLYPMPSFIGRLNAYYQAKAFKDAAEIQTGIKVYYFSKFNSREYFQYSMNLQFLQIRLLLVVNQLQMLILT